MHLQAVHRSFGFADTVSFKAAFLISLILVLYFCLVSVVLTYGAALFGTFVRAKEF